LNLYVVLFTPKMEGGVNRALLKSCPFQPRGDSTSELTYKWNMMLSAMFIFKLVLLRRHIRTYNSDMPFQGPT